MKTLRRILVLAVCSIVLTGCGIGSYRGRGIRIAEKDKWETTTHVESSLPLPIPGAGVKVDTGISERSELEFGVIPLNYVSDSVLGVGTDVGGKYLIFDEKISNDFMSLAIGSRIIIPLFGRKIYSGQNLNFTEFLSYLSLDLDLTGIGFTFRP